MVEDAALRRVRFTAFAGPLAVLSALFSAVYAISGFLLGSIELLACGALGFGLAVVSAWSRTLVRQGRIVAAATSVAAGLMTVAFTFSILLPFTFPTLVMMPIAAVALVLPYLEGQPLQRVIIAGVGVSLAAAAIGITRADTVSMPVQLRAFVLLGTIAVAVCLIMLLLWQYSNRLRELFDGIVRANTAVRASDDRFRSLVLATTQIVWSSDAAGTEFADSASWRAFTGQPFEETRNLGWALAIHPDDRARVVGEWTAAVAAGGPYLSRHRLRRADGTWVPCVARATPVYEADGSIREWIGAHTDVSAEHRAEQLLIEESRRKDEFLAMLSHELRNPLAPVITALDLLRVRSAVVPREIDVIERQVHHLKRLLEDLLDVSRITSGKIALHPERADLAAVVERGVEIALPFLRSRSQGLTVDIPPGLMVQGDRVRLAQVVENLLTNAAKYSPPRSRVRVTGVRHGSELVLEVADEGIGIDPELLPHVFDLFQQGDVSIDRSHGGLGIGLSLVKRLVELHGGRVEARSAGRDAGSTFTVRLPAAEPVASEGVAPVRSEATGVLRVVVVDDNIDAAELMGELLALRGHTVEIAHDGESGLALAKRFRPDVVFLDIGLPGMDGLEVARRLREPESACTARLVAVTGYGQAADRARTADAGFTDHLVKPVPLEEVQRILSEAVAAREVGPPERQRA